MKKDRNSRRKAVICLDLEKVFIIPISDGVQFLIKQKFSAYNITALFSLTKAYFAGRHVGGFDRGIVSKGIVSDHPNIKELTI